jgi:aminopeptidase N
LTQAFGAKKLTIVVPSSANEPLAKAYGELAQSWKSSGPDEVNVVDDSEIAAVPTDTSVIILGWENRFLSQILPELTKHGVRVDADSLTIKKETFPKTHHSVAITIRNPKHEELALTWIAGDPAEAIAGLARKLPHYHNFSYLVFEGGEPTIVAKGYWPVLESPLTVFIPRDDGSNEKVEMGKLRPRKPLARLP